MRAVRVKTVLMEAAQMEIDGSNITMAAKLIAVGLAVGVAAGAFLYRVFFIGRWAGEMEARQRAQGAELTYLRDKIDRIEQ